MGDPEFECNGRVVPRKASLYPPWVASQLPSAIAEQSAAYKASRFATPISDTEDEASAPVAGDKYTCADDMQTDSRATSQACLQFDPLRAFSAINVYPDQCLARILNEGQVRQCRVHPKAGNDLCPVHNKHRGKEDSLRQGNRRCAVFHGYRVAAEDESVS